MRKLFVLLFAVAMLFAFSAAPADAWCYNRCENNDCVTKGFVTYQDCHMSGSVCIDDPVWGECSAPTAEARVALSDIYAAVTPAEEPVAPACSQ
jgi:hypothetical protein